MMGEHGFENLNWFMGIVEDNADPVNHGRIRVRAFGIHPPVQTNEVPTEDLPWAFMINGTGGKFFSVPDNGDWVFGFFADGRDAQHPFVLGVIFGANQGLSWDGRTGLGAGSIPTNTDFNATLPPLPEGVVRDRAQFAMEYFISQGWTPEQSAGLVGNLIAESNLDNEAFFSNGREESFGIAQWNSVGSPERVENAKRVMGVSDIRNATYQDQLRFIQWELTNTESRAGNLLRQSTDVSSSASVVDQFYERSDGTKRNRRIQEAERLLSGF